MRIAVNHLKKADPLLAKLVQVVGPYRIEYREPQFATLARSIVYQQLSGKAAGTIYGRLEEATGGVTPDAVLALDEARLRSLGLSSQKTSYVRDLARRTAEGSLRFGELPALDDETVIARLTAVRGVGVWTAQMFLIFALRRRDVLPVADLGVRNAMQRLYGLDAPPDAPRMETIAAPWRPWRSVACWYLWRSLDGPAAL
ncbi:MAG: DNA-3-methyladenine glycosylase 2 family protein [Bryobacterales bacterium]|nr:DNA-3-methyladenine glycosylase 2 family protein [Bryobacterales bacterium]